MKCLLKIKNWQKFQHYKHRNPPWIKLHKTLLDDPDWHDLSADLTKVLVNLWLIASECNGELPASRVLAFRLRTDEKTLSLWISKLSHWIEQPASITLASRLHDADSEKSREEKSRGESERGKSNGEDGDSAKRTLDEEFEEFWKTYPREVGKAAAKRLYLRTRKKVDHAVIMAGLTCSKKNPQWFDRKFIPHPATWLNQGRWADEDTQSDSNERFILS